MVNERPIFETVEGGDPPLSPATMKLLTGWVGGMKQLGVQYGQPDPFKPGAVEGIDVTTPEKALAFIMSRCPCSTHAIYVEIESNRHKALQVLAGLMGTG